MAQARFDALRSLAFGGLSGTYAPVGTAVTKNFVVFKVVNTTNADVTGSFDAGVTDNIFIPAGSFCLYDLSTNAPPIPVNDSLVMSIGTRLYAKATGASSGAVYFEGLYAK